MIAPCLGRAQNPAYRPAAPHPGPLLRERVPARWETLHFRSFSLLIYASCDSMGQVNLSALHFMDIILWMVSYSSIGSLQPQRGYVFKVKTLVKGKGFVGVPCANQVLWVNQPIDCSLPMVNVQNIDSPNTHPIPSARQFPGVPLTRQRWCGCDRSQRLRSSLQNKN